MDVELKKIKSLKRLEKREDVYCLAAIENGNMIANGIVVKNCDALRYVLASHKVPTYHKTEPKEQVYEAYKNKFDPWKGR